MMALTQSAQPAIQVVTTAPESRKEPGASLHLASFPSNGVNVAVRVFVPGGPGPHPVLVLFHGFPGTELNFDLAHAAMRAGWAVLIPHYRGSWGVSGKYSWQHALEDGFALVEWVGSPATRAEYQLRDQSPVLAGHSLGGFVALRVAARMPDVRGVASIAGFNFGAFAEYLLGPGDPGPEVQERAIARTGEAWQSSTAMLTGTSGRALAEEAIAHRRDWNLNATAEMLRNRPLLLVAAERDDIAEPWLHHAPFVEALIQAGATQLTQSTLPGGHGLEESRLELTRLLLDWLRSIEPDL